MKSAQIVLVLATIGIFTISPAKGQDARDIMLLAYETSQAIQQGYYEMTTHKKYMSGPDTTISTKRTWFKKLPKDDCFGFAFQTNFKKDGEYMGIIVYTGDELITGNGDSTVLVRSVRRWKDEIKDIKHNYDVYGPFLEADLALITPKDLKDKDTKVSLLGESRWHQEACYLVEVEHSIENDPKEPMQIIHAVNTYWITKLNPTVVQYETSIMLEMNKDTMIQYELATLDTFIVNQPIDESKLSLNTVPDYYTFKDYTPYKETPLLKTQTPAPTWHLVSLDDDSVKLTDLRGNLVLIDFFYKSCYPCMQALPALQSLHEKYNDKGLRVVGIDPYDTEEDDLKNFLAKRNVNYTILYADREFPKTYNVTGYPTLYLLDREGTIIHGQSGYGPTTEEKLEKIILKHL